MKKLAALVFTFLTSTLIVTEIRTQRSMECFGCINVKCIIRSVDEHPQLLLTDPDAVIDAFHRVPYWWD